ncbi:hypothetical protein ACFL0P_07230 [Candidatus Omnitrophota bacterium]
MDNKNIVKMLKEIGESRNFTVLTEVAAAKGEYWVDLVWFDSRIPASLFGKKKPHLNNSFMLPLVAFEIEVATSAGKHIKGTIKNLEALNALTSCIVVYEKKMHKHLKSIKTLARDSLCNIAVMTDKEIQTIYNKLVKK